MKFMSKVSKHEAIARTARRYRESTGNQITQEQARKEVALRIERQERRNKENG